MSNPAILTTFGLPDPNAAPLNVTELVNLLNTLVTSNLQGDYIPYIISSDTPAVEDQDKAWIEKDTAGRPISVKIFYNGNWRRVYNGMIGEVRGYTGDPSTDFDSNGLGLVGGRYDGWHLMNGMDGVPDASDRFIIGGHMNNLGGHTGYSSGWQTFVDGVSDIGPTGGAANTMVQSQHLPPFDAANGLSQVVIHGHEDKDSEDHTPDVQPLISPHYANLLTHDWVIGNYGASPNGSPPIPQVALPTLPPFYVLAFIAFVGYS